MLRALFFYSKEQYAVVILQKIPSVFQYLRVRPYVYNTNPNPKIAILLTSPPNFPPRCGYFHSVVAADPFLASAAALEEKNAAADPFLAPTATPAEKAARPAAESVATVALPTPLNFPALEDEKAARPPSPCAPRHRSLHPLRPRSGWWLAGKAQPSSGGPERSAPFLRRARAVSISSRHHCREEHRATFDSWLRSAAVVPALDEHELLLTIRQEVSPFPASSARPFF